MRRNSWWTMYMERESVTLKRDMGEEYMEKLGMEGVLEGTKKGNKGRQAQRLQGIIHYQVTT